MDSKRGSKHTFTDHHMDHPFRWNTKLSQTWSGIESLTIKHGAMGGIDWIYFRELIQSAPRLRELFLNFDDERVSSRLLELLRDKSVCFQLETLSLSNCCTIWKPSDLEQLLHSHRKSLQTLNLDSVIIDGNGWPAMFKGLLNGFSALRRLRICDLFTDAGLCDTIHYDLSMAMKNPNMDVVLKDLLSVHRFGGIVGSRLPRTSYGCCTLDYC
ncbi:hypothetical protein BDW69DRAFT_155132 [Aspergillus filifer]